MGGVFTRDSVIWWLLLVAACLGYLKTVDAPPTEWTYEQWVNAGIFLSGWLIGKMQTSPRPHSEYGAAKITPQDLKP